MRKRSVYASLAIMVVLVMGGTGAVIAADAKAVFAGKILLLKKIPPTYFPTKNGFVQFLKKNRITKLHANKNNEWHFDSMAFFKRPLGDYEVEMVFYDITDGGGKSKENFKDSFTQYTQDRSTRSLLGRAILTRPRFDANRKYLVEVQKHGKAVASGQFETKGVSQARLDEQARVEAEMEEMKKSMKELEEKAAKQEAEQKEKDAEAAGDLF